jgi:gamma-glutamyltranspeptidase/glutathione hydrolase
VPGAISGWIRLLEDHGSLPLERLLQPAIALAQEGFVVTPRVASDWARNVGKISRNAGASKHLLKSGRAPQEGAIVRFPALAATLKRIAKDGRDGFYKGESAKDMVAELRAPGRAAHARRLRGAGRERRLRDAHLGAYRGVELVELPPSNHGIVALIMPRCSSAWASRIPSRLGRALPRAHGGRTTAFAMRDAFVADPDMAQGRSTIC